MGSMSYLNSSDAIPDLPGRRKQRRKLAAVRVLPGAANDAQELWAFESSTHIWATKHLTTGSAGAAKMAR